MVLAALLVALGIGWQESRPMSASEIPLEKLPVHVGPWAAAHQAVDVSANGEYKTLTRTYRSDQNDELELTVQATFTRLGSLRDWSLAKAAEGWMPEETTTVKLGSGADNIEPEVRIQKLTNGTQRVWALTWYTSAGVQASTLRQAQLVAWGERLKGSKQPWGSLYLVARPPADVDSEESLKSCAGELALSLRQTLANASVRAGSLVQRSEPQLANG